MSRIAFSILLVCLGSPVRAADAFKLVSVNILNCRPSDGEMTKAYMKRFDSLIPKLKALDADLYLLQEVTNCAFPDSWKFLKVDKMIAEETGLSHHYWRSEGITRVWEEGIGFYWDPARISLTGIKCEHLKTTKSGALFTITKSLCRAEVEARDGRRLKVYHTHLDTEAKYSVPQTKEILAVLKKETGPADRVVLAGDFNNKPGTAAIKLIEAEGYAPTAQNWVDYIFTKGLGQGLDPKVLDFKSDKTSDHDGLSLSVKLMPWASSHSGD